MSRDQWESEYADLGGPGCWSDERNRQYKAVVEATVQAEEERRQARMERARRIDKAMMTSMMITIISAECWAFVYVDCGEHGSWGVGSCSSCDDGFAGERCQLAPAHAGNALPSGSLERLASSS